METKNTLKIVFTTILILLICNTGNTKNITGMQLQKLIEEWLQNKGKQSNITILKELQYPDCDKTKLIINDISGNFKLIKVNCYGKNPWQFIVRNKTKKKIEKKRKIVKHEEVLALKNSKNKGEIIFEDDIVSIIKKKGLKNTYITNKKEVIGKKLTKSMRPNQVLKYSSVKNDWLIEKNAKVTIINNKSFITIKEEGLAMNDANFMEEIRVKNIKSGKIIVGYAKNKKKVILNTKQN